MKRHIFGISDSASFFAAGGSEPLLARKIISLADKPNPTICYVGAAKGDRPERIEEFQLLCERLGALPMILNLFEATTGDPEQFFAGADIIFIDGGSTRNLMAIFDEWGVTRALRNAYESGVIISGASAGINIFFEWNITDSIRTEIAPIEGYGWIKGSICVHHDAHPDRPAVFRKFLLNGSAKFPAYAMDDATAVHFEDEKLIAAYAVSRTAKLDRMARNDNEITSASVSLALIEGG